MYEQRINWKDNLNEISDLKIVKEITLDQLVRMPIGKISERFPFLKEEYEKIDKLCYGVWKCLNQPRLN